MHAYTLTFNDSFSHSVYNSSIFQNNSDVLVSYVSTIQQNGDGFKYKITFISDCSLLKGLGIIIHIITATIKPDLLSVSVSDYRALFR